MAGTHEAAPMDAPPPSPPPPPPPPPAEAHAHKSGAVVVASADLPVDGVVAMEGSGAVVAGVVAGGGSAAAADGAGAPANGIPRLPLQPPGGIVQGFRAEDGEQPIVANAVFQEPGAVVLATVCPTVSAEIVGGIKGDDEGGDGDDDDDDKDGTLDESMDGGMKTKQQRTHHRYLPPHPSMRCPGLTKRLVSPAARSQTSCGRT
eukprot:3356711-Rhodomonas_salina.3